MFVINLLLTKNVSMNKTFLNCHSSGLNTDLTLTRVCLTEENFTKFQEKFDKINKFFLIYLVFKMVISIEESLTDLPTPNLLETATMEVRKNNLSREDICNVISYITNIWEIVHHDLQELKQKSTKKFQETDSFIKEYQELKQYVLKICGNYNEKNE